MPDLALLPALALILIVGAAARWVAARLRVPSILLLLLAGLAVGPLAQLVLGAPLLRPEQVFGEALSPLVSLAVALLLYEGGLSLRLPELKQHGHVVRNLVTIGVLVSWVLGAGAAYLLGLLAFDLALLLGAILVVTGPTVIGPLLQNLRLEGPTGPILKWEGILIDPIGATLAVLVFEAVLPTGGAGAPQAVLGFFNTLAVACVLGVLGAALLVVPLRRHWLPDTVENGVSLALMTLTFVLSDALQPEAGLLAVTVMGFAVANTVPAPQVRHIVEFKENLRDILIPGLFVVLAALLQPGDLSAILGWRLALFLGFMLLVVRPLSVWVSTVGSRLERRERLFLALVAPRGIVAAAVSSIFALALVRAGRPEAQAISAITFALIIVTVSVYGLLAVRLAPALGLAARDPQGLLIVGASPWIRAVARALHDAEVPVVLVDKNFSNVSEARQEGLEAVHANALSDSALEELPLGGLGRLLALTSNDEVNSLAAQRFAELFGRSQVYQLPPRIEGPERHVPTHQHPVRYLFGSSATYERLEARHAAGAQVKATGLTEAFTLADWSARYGEQATQMFLVTRRAGAHPLVRIVTADRTPTAHPGDLLIALVEDEAAAAAPPQRPVSAAAGAV